MTTRVLLIGGTGLTGHSVDACLAKQPDTIVTSLTRRQSSGSDHVIDFERLCAAPDATLRAVASTGADVAISCLGTTIRATGSQAAMFRVDHDYVPAFAKQAAPALHEACMTWFVVLAAHDDITLSQALQEQWNNGKLPAFVPEGKDGLWLR